jgi:hypothetical protein
VVQNLLVVLCAAVVYCVFHFGLDKETASVSDILIQVMTIFCVLAVKRDLVFVVVTFMIYFTCT